MNHLIKCDFERDGKDLYFKVKILVRDECLDDKNNMDLWRAPRFAFDVLDCILNDYPQHRELKSERRKEVGDLGDKLPNKAKTW